MPNGSDVGDDGESMEPEQDRKDGLGRRQFSPRRGRRFGVAAAARSSAADAATAAQAYDPGEDETKARYRESDHVQGVLPHQRLRDVEEVRAPC